MKNANEIDPLETWKESLEKFARQARAAGAAATEPALFDELIPRLVQLVDVLLEVTDEEEGGEQVVFVRFSTAANLRAWLAGQDNPEAFALLAQLEADLTGSDQSELVDQLQEILAGQPAGQQPPPAAPPAAPPEEPKEGDQQ
jgi:hypothetical protein